MVPSSNLDRETAIEEIGRKVHGDERQLETAGEIAEHKQGVRALSKGLRERLPKRLLGSAPAHVPLDPAGCERERKRQHDQHDGAEYSERLLPSHGVDERHRERRVEKLSERAGGGTRAERERAPAWRQQLAESGKHDPERASRQAETDEEPGGDIEH
jgi:hypothetical protein